ncbi:O-succinylhomoserine (thiol)-lyase [Thaumasiovibrio sp. DFM-14]|uniref:O-succinylhomoserine (thiol)-lyase n=1 Tax=Thaumasiovibrio sp. DFM-14 TaxID=3384792 RepID=UPI00399F2E22
MSDKQLATIAVRTGIESDSQYNAVVPPIYLTTNYGFTQLGEVPEYDYSRGGNPTRDLVGDAIAQLEGGAGAVVTNCGTSAINLLISALLGVDDLILAPHDCYGGTYRLFNSRAQKGDFQLQFVDQYDDNAFEQALQAKPALIWLETPSNPLLRIVDIEKVCKKAREIGALVVVDNTFLSPVWQRPLTLGADFVVHSTTKYLNGHSDVIGGALVARDEQQIETLRWWGNCIGATGGAFDAYLTLRGLRTLVPRMRMHEENCQAVLDCLQHQERVSALYHPSLPAHPGHDIAAKQQTGFGAMLSFELSATEEELKTFLHALQHFSLAESLGGVESLICHPSSMTHRAMSDEAQREAGIGAGLLRLSVGLEDSRDLVADLQQAFARLERGHNE